MNKQLKTVAALSSILIFTACGESQKNQSVEVNTAKEVKAEKKRTADIADASFKDGMTGKIFHNYLQVKMALVNSDSDGVQKAAEELAESFGKERGEMKLIAEQIAQRDELEEQRQLFSDLTNKVTPLIEENLNGGTIYKKYCPMAFNNQGAYWLSDIEEINNPYFGDKMLRCGKIEKVIKK